MKRFIVAVLMVVGLSSCLLAAPPKGIKTANPYGGYKFYGKSGSYQGRISSSGLIYDKSNRYEGRISNNGNIYGRNGQFQGRIKK